MQNKIKFLDESSISFKIENSMLEVYDQYDELIGSQPLPIPYDENMNGDEIYQKAAECGYDIDDMISDIVKKSVEETKQYDFWLSDDVVIFYSPTQGACTSEPYEGVFAKLRDIYNEEKRNHELGADDVETENLDCPIEENDDSLTDTVEDNTDTTVEDERETIVDETPTIEEEIPESKVEPVIEKKEPPVLKKKEEKKPQNAPTPKQNNQPQPKHEDKKPQNTQPKHEEKKPQNAPTPKQNNQPQPKHEEKKPQNTQPKHEEKKPQNAPTPKQNNQPQPKHEDKKPQQNNSPKNENRELSFCAVTDSKKMSDFKAAIQAIATYNSKNSDKKIGEVANMVVQLIETKGINPNNANEKDLVYDLALNNVTIIEGLSPVRAGIYKAMLLKELKNLGF